jgi:hypothetical protein
MFGETIEVMMSNLPFSRGEGCDDGVEEKVEDVNSTAALGEGKLGWQRSKTSNFEISLTMMRCCDEESGGNHLVFFVMNIGTLAIFF